MTGIENGAAYEQSGSFENFMMSLANGTLPISSGLEATGNSTEEESSMSIMATSGYWLPQLAPKGVVRNEAPCKSGLPVIHADSYL